NFGFYLLGPAEDKHDAKPMQIPGTVLTNTLSKHAMRFVVPAEAPDEDLKPTILLRRLACPYIRPNDKHGFGYNPYVTIDYLEDVEVNNALTPLSQQHSVGRQQPYAAFRANKNFQKPQPALIGQPQHTFFMHNMDDNTLPVLPPVPPVPPA